MRALLLVGLLVCPTARAATYVDEPALGHWTVGAGVHGGTTVARDTPLLPMGVAGVTSATGYLWESGLAVLACGGFNVQTTDTPHGAMVGAEAASLREWSLGLALRYVPWPRLDLAPFLEVGAHTAWLRTDEVSGQGALLTGKLGVRVRLDGFEPWVAVAADELYGRLLPGGRALRATLGAGILVDL